MSTGRQQEFEQLALPLLDPLHNFAYSLCRDHDEARDLVQESLARALNAFHSFNGPGKFRNWMFTILRNAFLNRREALRHRSTLQWDSGYGGEMTMAKPSPEAEFIQKIDDGNVRMAIARLPTEFRQVILLIDIEDWKYKDAAKALRIPIGTVMSRLARARRQIREQLTREKEPSSGGRPGDLTKT